MFFPLRLPFPFMVINFLCVLSTLFFCILMNTYICIVQFSHSVMSDSATP